MDLKMALRVERVLEEVILGAVRVNELEARVEVEDYEEFHQVVIKLTLKGGDSEAKVSGPEKD